MNIHFLTFASSNWTEAPKRMRVQTDYIQTNFNFFKSVSICNEKDLSEQWNNKYSRYFNEHGFALWSWKPYLIQQQLNKIDDGDCLLYADAGCSFPTADFVNFSENLKEHIENINNCKLKIGIEPCLHATYPNYIIIRKQILEKFGLLEDAFFLTKWLHYEAGILLFIKDENTMKFINEQVKFFEDHFEDSIYSNFMDRSGQYNGFVHNGSDQAVLQCMLYKNINKFYTILDNIYYRYGFYARQTEYKYPRP